MVDASPILARRTGFLGSEQTARRPFATRARGADPRAEGVTLGPRPAHTDPQGPEVAPRRTRELACESVSDE